MVTITAPSAAAAAALARALPAVQLSVDVSVSPEVSGSGFQLSAAGNVLEVQAPVRLGTLLQKAQALAAPPPSEKIREIGAYRLDLVEKTWARAGDKEGLASLTDREVALLEALILAPGHSLDRSVLLEQVWGYHKDAETHTLETHIYRLRRKIEADAASPKILLTEGASYRLAAV